MQPEELLVVYTTNDAMQAEIIRGALNAEGIHCDIDGEVQAGFTGAGVLEIKLLVPAADYDRARSFLAKHERGPGC